jgi:hypothetical protein
VTKPLVELGGKYCGAVFYDYPQAPKHEARTNAEEARSHVKELRRSVPSHCCLTGAKDDKRSLPQGIHGENVIFRKQAGLTVIPNKDKPRLSRSPNSMPGIEKMVGLRKVIFRGGIHRRAVSFWVARRFELWYTGQMRRYSKCSIVILPCFPKSLVFAFVVRS